MRIQRWPFYLGDAVLLVAAVLIYQTGTRPLRSWELALAVLCIIAGGVLGVIPALVEYKTLAKLAESDRLTSVMDQMRNLEAVAAGISSATSRWQEAQGHADKTAEAARGISERMTAEVQGFTEFMKRASDSERSAMRLEIEKLRRVESEWVQVVVRMLDHVYALYIGASRSGQPRLVEPVGNFRQACVEATRRVGLVPFAEVDSETFDPERHQLTEGDPKEAIGKPVGEVIASGYTYQGRVLRPALVKLREASSAEKEIAPAPAEPAEGEPKAQTDLPLGDVEASPAQS